MYGKPRPALLCLSPYPYGQLYKGRADQRTEKYKEDILEVVPLFPSQDREEEKGSFLEKSFQELFCRVLYREKRRRTGGGAFGGHLQRS